MNKIQDATEKLSSLHPRVWKQLQLMPGVIGLGIGVRGWRIYVEGGMNSDGPAAWLPPEIAGFPTEIVCKQTSFLCYGNDFQATLKPGILITGKGMDGDGTLGCFARVQGEPNRIVLLSNSHVLYGDIAEYGGSGAGNEVGQPDVSCCCCCTSHVIGKNRGNGANAFNRVHVHVDHPRLEPEKREQVGSEIDCAAALLNGERPFTNQSEFYGMITGTPPAGSLGVSAGDAVEKVGSRTGHTKGTIAEFTFTATYVSGGSGAIPSILFPLKVGGGTSVDEIFSGAQGNINQFYVIPDPDPSDPAAKTFFANSGDSGSVVVNSAKQVIGIVTRMSPLPQDMIDYLNQFLTRPLPPHAGNLGIVCPIGKVLASLGIEIVDNMHGTVTTAGPILAVPDEVLQQREKVLALERTLQGLKQEIRQKALGREILEKIAEHRPEINRLIERNRAVKVAWQRCQGPAYAAHCLHSFEDQSYEVPFEVNGVTPLELVNRMARVLKMHGSERLQNDIRDYEQLALDWIAGCTSVWQLVDRIRRLDPVDGAAEAEVTADAGVCK